MLRAGQRNVITSLRVQSIERREFDISAIRLRVAALRSRNAIQAPGGALGRRKYSFSV